MFLYNIIETIIAIKYCCSIPKQRREYAEKYNFVFNVRIMLLNLDEYGWNLVGISAKMVKMAKQY